MLCSRVPSGDRAGPGRNAYRAAQSNLFSGLNGCDCTCLTVRHSGGSASLVKCDGTGRCQVDDEGDGNGAVR